MPDTALPSWLVSTAFGIEIAAAVLTVASMAYGLLALIAAWSYRATAQRNLRLPSLTKGNAPGVSILKPVKGMDDSMIEAFRSHCRQSYAGPYELIFGAGSEDDPAVPAVRNLMAEFADPAIRLVFCPERRGTNGKVSNLIQMLPEARYDYLLINDSDIRVSPQYLDRVMQQFLQPGKRPVGMVTTLYRGRTHGTLWSKLEALGIATDFMAGVLTARFIEGGIHFALGSTLAVRREALEGMGGLPVLVDQLADDYEMGARVDKAGYAIRLAPETVDTSVPPYNLSGFWSHQMRWARTVRDSRKWGFVGLLFTHTLPLALAFGIASGGSLWSLWLLAMAYLLRLTTALQVGFGVLRDRQVLRDLWLLPLRDLVGFAIWVWSFADNTIEWRGERFVVRDGRLQKP